MKIRLAILLVLAALLMASISAAQADPLAYDLPWWTAASGGGDSLGGPYHLQATAGQAGPGALSGGPYALAGGYWAPASTLIRRIFVPMVVKPH